MEIHEIHLDFVGLNSRPRYSCYGPDCGGIVLVAEPHMTKDSWSEKKAEFFRKHPCHKIINGGLRGLREQE